MKHQKRIGQNAPSIRCKELFIGALLVVLGGCGGGGVGGGGGGAEWYYHWQCNGDRECLYQHNNVDSGTIDAGPDGQGGQQNCGSLYQQDARFDGAAFRGYCDTTQNPVPVVAISVSPRQISHGASATLTWSGSWASSCSASGSWSGPQSLSGSQTLSPSAGTYTYTLACQGPGGSRSNYATLTVTALAKFNHPEKLVADSAGNLFVADTNNYTIRKITPQGIVSTFAGVAGAGGSIDGTGANARFYYPTGIGIDQSDNLYVADAGNNTIRKITPSAVVTTFAGTPNSSGGYADGTGAAAAFRSPYGVAVDSTGNVFIADTSNYIIRKITPAGVVTTFAGTPNTQGSSDATGTAASFKAPYGITLDSSNNIFVADADNYTIREISPSAVVTTYAGTFYRPFGIAVDSSKNLFVTEDYNSDVLEITPSKSVTTVAGGPQAVIKFNNPHGVAVDSSGNVYVSDTFNDAIRKIANGVVTNFAGDPGVAGSQDQ